MKRLALRPGAIDRARRLRRDMTAQERTLWRALRANFPAAHFRKQVPMGAYTVDFASHGARLVIEADGGQHGTEAGKAQDAVRTAFLNGEGYRVLRFWNNDIVSNLDGVLTLIGAALAPSGDENSGAQTRAAPASRPPHQGEEAIGQSAIGVC